jgi:hypothetical protein
VCRLSFATHKARCTGHRRLSSTAPHQLFQQTHNQHTSQTHSNSGTFVGSFSRRRSTEGDTRSNTNNMATKPDSAPLDEYETKVDTTRVCVCVCACWACGVLAASLVVALLVPSLGVLHNAPTQTQHNSGTANRIQAQHVDSRQTAQTAPAAATSDVCWSASLSLCLDGQ